MRWRIFLNPGLLAGLLLAPVCYAELNATGITYSGNIPKGINEECLVADSVEVSSDDLNILKQQDCAVSSREGINPGHVFQYVKVSRTGEQILPPYSRS